MFQSGPRRRTFTASGSEDVDRFAAMGANATPRTIAATFVVTIGDT